MRGLRGDPLCWERLRLSRVAKPSRGLAPRDRSGFPLARRVVSKSEQLCTAGRASWQGPEDTRLVGVPEPLQPTKISTSLAGETGGATRAASRPSSEHPRSSARALASPLASAVPRAPSDPPAPRQHSPRTPDDSADSPVGTTPLIRTLSPQEGQRTRRRPPHGGAVPSSPRTPWWSPGASPVETRSLS